MARKKRSMADVSVPIQPDAATQRKPGLPTEIKPSQIKRSPSANRLNTESSTENNDNNRALRVPNKLQRKSKLKCVKSDDSAPFLSPRK